MDIRQVGEAYNDLFDKYFGAEVVIHGKDCMAVLAKLRKHKHDHNTDPMERNNPNPNPLLDSRIYEL